MSVARNFFLAGTGTLVSRMLGFARDAAIAWLLGAGASADALSVALRLPYVARRMLGEGTLSLSLTAACVTCKNARLARAAIRKTALWAGILVLAGIFAAPLIARALAARPGAFDETVRLVRICLPYLFFAAITACSMAGLHALGQFGLPGFAPSLFNIAMLCAAACAALTCAPPETAALWFAGGVLAGGCCQWLALCPALARLTRKAPPPPAAALAAAMKGLPAGLFAAAIPQLAFVVAAIPAAWLKEGSLAALFYAERLLEFPLGITAASLGMALVPTLAASDGNDAEKSSRRVSAALGLSLLVNLPAAAGLLACADPLVRLLFQHGAFNDSAARLTTLALCASTPALPAYALTRPLLAISETLGLKHSLTRPSLFALFAALAACAGLTALFPSPAAPALGVALGIWVQTGLLLRLVRQRLKLRLPWRFFLCAMAGCTAVYAAARTVIACGQAAAWTPLALVAAAVPTGIGVYCVCLFFVRNDISILFAFLGHGGKRHKTMQNIKPSAEPGQNT